VYALEIIVLPSSPHPFFSRPHDPPCLQKGSGPGKFSGVGPLFLSILLGALPGSLIFTNHGLFWVALVGPVLPSHGSLSFRPLKASAGFCVFQPRCAIFFSLHGHGLELFFFPPPRVTQPGLPFSLFRKPLALMVVVSDPPPPPVALFPHNSKLSFPHYTFSPFFRYVGARSHLTLAFWTKAPLLKQGTPLSTCDSLADEVFLVPRFHRLLFGPQRLSLR